jgi:hypothetical protein
MNNPLTLIYPWVDEGDQFRATFALDGVTACAVDYAAQSSGRSNVPVCKFTISHGTKRLRLSGEWIPKNGKRSTFDKTWQLMDFAPFTGDLYNFSRPLIDRVISFNKKLLATEIEFEGDFRNVLALREATSQEADFDAAELRLNVKLPMALRELLRYRIAINEQSQFFDATRLDFVAAEAMRNWGYNGPGPNLDDVTSPEIKTLYERSVLVFTEVGDGCGGLAWDPSGAGEGDWFWVHEEFIAKPVFLRRVDGQPLPAADALLNVIQRFVIPTLSDSLEYSADDSEFQFALEVDTAHPAARMTLSFDNQSRMPQLHFRSYDYYDAMLEQQSY